MQVERNLTVKKATMLKKYANTYAIIFLSVILFDAFSFFVYASFEKPITGYKYLMTTAVYPFNIDSWVTKGLLYCNQIFIIMHTASIPIFDGISMLLIFNCTHSMKILENNFKLAESFSDLVKCISEHNDILQ